jgi:replicative DNA helicase
MTFPATISEGVKLPQDVDLEQAILGACFARPEMIDAIFEVCSAADFFNNPHAAIAEAVAALHGEQMPITPLTVSGRLATNEGLTEIGGKDYLAAMTMAAPASGIIPLARSLVDLRLRREAILATQESQDALGEPSIGLSEAMRPVLQAADHVATALGRRDFTPIRQAADEMLIRAADRAKGKKDDTATTGLTLLDETIGGLQAGTLNIIAGRPGMGKTAMMQHTALRSAMLGRTVLFFSLEMTQEGLLQRIGTDLDFDANPRKPLSYSWFWNGSANFDDIGRMTEALHRLPERLMIFENGKLTIQEIAAISRARAAQTDGMGLVVIDYLQKVDASDRYKGNRVQEVTEISGAAKALAMRLKWPVVAGAQLNRGVESREEKRPTLTDLRESGSIEQDADVVIGLYRPAYYIEKRKPAAGPVDPGWDAWRSDWELEKNRLDLHVLKNRNGAEDSFSVFCDMRASAIRDEAPRGLP